MIVKRPTIATICDELRDLGNEIVFTNGCFDIIHLGHIQHLSESKRFGDVLVVGLNSDSSVKRLKGEERPINNEIDRAKVLIALSAVDFVCIFDEDTPLELIKVIKPDVLTKGGDYAFENIVGAEFVINNGGRVIVNNFVDGKSSTSIINKMKS